MAKPKAFPKSMGACADLLHEMKQKRLEADKHAAALKAEENRLIEHIINNLDKNSTGAAGKAYRVQVKTKPKLRVLPEHWDKFYAYVAKNKAWDMLQRRISDEAVMARALDANGKLTKKVPGIEKFDAVTVSLTKV